MKYIIFSLFLATSLAFSQKEASIWYFGTNAGIKFDASGAVTVLTDGQLNTDEGCATIADTNGNLLFYTDGTTVWNKNHQIMSNGTGLMGNWSSTQSATIVPMPGNSNLFYVFTLDFEANANGFRYSIVDMSLNSGLGAVTSNKNVLIYTPSNEKLAIVKHANNIDYWVVTHGWNNNAFYSYLLTSTGLSATPVTSNIDPLIKMAIIHYQFESIYPFYDGNGRTGRIINILYLVLQGLLDIPILYLSRYITQNKAEYYQVLQDVRTKNDWEHLILYFLKSVEVTAMQTIDLITNINVLMQDYNDKLKLELPKIYSQDLLNILFKNPYTKIEFLEKELGIARQTASIYLDKIASVGLLEKVKVKNTNYYMNNSLIDCLINNNVRINEKS